jgi:hypothetical protein
VNAKTGFSFLTTLILGDLIAILLVTLVGFIFHGESIANPRWLTTFFPFAAAWALQAPWLGLYRPAVVGNIRAAWWRAALAALLAAPMAGLLRALLLGSVVIPVFVSVLALTAAAGMALWRLAFTLGNRRLEKNG